MLLYYCRVCIFLNKTRRSDFIVATLNVAFVKIEEDLHNLFSGSSKDILFSRVVICSKALIFCGAFIDILLLELFKASITWSEESSFNYCNSSLK